MAKKQTSPSTFSFATLCKDLSKINPYSSILKSNPYAKIDEWIGLGNYLLNAQLTGSLFKGVPRGRVTQIAGPSKTGKTYLCLNIAREAQKMGYDVIWLDTESSVDIDMMERFGIDSSRVDYQPIPTLNLATTVLRNFCDTLEKLQLAGEELPKIIVIVDSTGNFGTDKERGDALTGSDKKDMTLQQAMKKFYRIIIHDFGVLKVPCVVTNQTHKDIGSFIARDVIGGGGGVEYNPSITLMLSIAQLKEDNVNKTGVIVTSKVHKSRFTREITIKFHISFIKGMNQYVGLEKYVDYDICGVGPGKLENGVYVKDNSENPKYYAVNHLNKHIKARELWSSTVFTEEVLNKLDEKIKLLFEFPDPVKAQMEEIDEILNIDKITGEIIENDDEEVIILNE